MNVPIVLLVHGMGRTPVSLFRLAARLRKLGYRPSFFAYSAMLETFTGITARLTSKLQSLGPAPYLCIGHSLGGLLLRQALHDLPELYPLPRGLLMLGTPNQSPRLARLLGHRPFYRLFFGDCGQMLRHPLRLQAIPLPCVPSLNVVGTAGPTGMLSPFPGTPNDGIVACSETVLRYTPAVEVHALHSFLMDHPRIPELLGSLHSRRCAA